MVIYTAALQVSQPNWLYTRLPGVNIKFLFTRQPCQSEFGYIHGCRVSTNNRYLHGSHSRAKSAIYIAAGCIKNRYLHGSRSRAKSDIYIATGVYIKLLFSRQPFKSQIGYKHCCRRVTVHIKGCILSTLTTNEIWQSCIKYEIYLDNCGMQIFWYHSYFRHDFQMFPDAINSFHIVRWYTYTCSNIKLNAIKLVLLKLIKMTTNAKYVAPRAEDLNSAFNQKPTLVLHLTKRHMISINLEKTCNASGFFFMFFAFERTAV